MLLHTMTWRYYCTSNSDLDCNVEEVPSPSKWPSLNCSKWGIMRESFLPSFEISHTPQVLPRNSSFYGNFTVSGNFLAALVAIFSRSGLLMCWWSRPKWLICQNRTHLTWQDDLSTSATSISFLLVFIMHHIGFCYIIKHPNLLIPFITSFPDFLKAKMSPFCPWQKIGFEGKVAERLVGQMMWARNRAGPVFIRNLSWENSDGCSGDDHHYSHLAVRFQKTIVVN